MPTLGKLELKNPFILAPMESVSDCAWRRLCAEQGAALTFTEMVRANALARGNKSTAELIDTHDAEVPTGVQLLVANERELAAALRTLEQLPQASNLCAVDLNFGCPSPEVIRAGAGPALLKRRAKLEAIFETLRAWQRTTPLRIGAVGAKIRLGLNRLEQDQKVYLPIVELANQHLDYLTIHARHARQDSTSPPTWSAVAEAVARARIPIIANGDLTCADDWRRVSAETGASFALIARAAIRSPWVFRGLTGGEGLPGSHEEIDAARTRYDALADHPPQVPRLARRGLPAHARPPRRAAPRRPRAPRQRAHALTSARAYHLGYGAPALDPFVHKLVLRLFDEGAPLSRNRHFHTFETEEGRRALRISRRLKALRADIARCRAEGGESVVKTEADGDAVRVQIHLRSLRSTRQTTLEWAEYELLQRLLGDTA